MKTLFGFTRIAVALALLGLAACGSGEKETADQQQTSGQENLAATDQGTAQPAAENPSTAVSPEPEKSAAAPATAAPTSTPPASQAKPKPKAEPKIEPKAEPAKSTEPPPPVMVTIPSGATLTAALNTRLRTDSNQVGQQFTATTTEPLTVGSQVVVPSGSTVRGRLSEVEEPHRTSGRAKMTLLFYEVVTPDGKTYSVDALPIALEGEGDQISDEAKVVGGGVVGGVVGALASKKKTKGAAIGAAVGAAAGGALAIATKGKQIELAQGQQFKVEITQPVQVPVIVDAADKTP